MHSSNHKSVDIGNRSVLVEVSWECAQDNHKELDLDVAVFALDATGKLPDDSFFVFYNNPTSRDQAIELQGGDLARSDAPDEVVRIDLSRVDSCVQQLVLVLSIYDFEHRRQHFGQLCSCILEVLDITDGSRLARLELDDKCSGEGAVELGKFCRDGDGWGLNKAAIGVPGGLQTLMGRYH